jgi:hypothetical protein
MEGRRGRRGGFDGRVTRLSFSESWNFGAEHSNDDADDYHTPLCFSQTGRQLLPNIPFLLPFSYVFLSLHNRLWTLLPYYFTTSPRRKTDPVWNAMDEIGMDWNLGRLF